MQMVQLGWACRGGKGDTEVSDLTVLDIVDPSMNEYIANRAAVFGTAFLFLDRSSTASCKSRVVLG